MTMDRWQKLMDALGFSDNASVYHALLNAYSESHRHYHTDKHIEAMLKHFDQVYDLLNRPAEVELAIWFHDAIYKPRSSSNELDSANWAVAFLQKNGQANNPNNASADLAARIHYLIMATQHDAVLPDDDGDAQLLVDIDLSILGTDERTYQHFEDNVRAEYAWVPFFIYRKKRAEILRSFLDREKIYYSDYFYSRYEAQARKNLTHAIAALS